MERVGGKWDYKISASRDWLVSFFSPGPPPLVVSHLQGKREGLFFEELVKLSDIRRVLDARAVLVAAPRALRPGNIPLVTNADVYVVIDSDIANLKVALAGGEISDVNVSTQLRLLGKKSREKTKECRSLILDLVSKRWMTLRELEEQLQWRFDVRTVRTQVRALRRAERVSICGRTRQGEGLLGIPGGQYQSRPDLSVSTMKSLLYREISRTIESASRPMSYREISEKLGVRSHVVTAILRGLAAEGLVERGPGGWRMRRSVN